jgi:hypothetical protein
MRGACTESPREWRNTAGAYLVQAPESYEMILGEGRAVPPVYSRASEGQQVCAEHKRIRAV